MTFWTLLRRSLRFHARSHLTVVLGAAVGSAALIGALIVGDSVKGTLRSQALQRLGGTAWAIASPDRLFRAELAHDLSQQPNRPPHAELFSSVLQLPATASTPDGSSRANRVQVLGVDDAFGQLAASPRFSALTHDVVLLSEPLAAQLGVQPGQTILLRVRKPSGLSQEAVVSPQSGTTVALRLRVQSIVPAAELGAFSLLSQPLPALNAFVSIAQLQNAVQNPGRANVLLVGASPASHSSRSPAAATDVQDLSALAQSLAQSWQLADAELEIRELPNSAAIELRSSRVFLDPAIATAIESFPTPGQKILTYLVNRFRVGDRITPYSMVTAAGEPFTPADLAHDEIVINQWLADDLQVGPGARLDLAYYLADSASRLVERTNQFRVRTVAPLAPPWADRELMPEFPGIAKAERTHDWDAGFALVPPPREKDEQYWKEQRGTPKAFVTLAAGQQMWTNRFGTLTAVRWTPTPPQTGRDLRQALESHLRRTLRPEAIGLRFDAVRHQALASAQQAQDFGGLFLGFSFFLIVAALILMALLFQFGLEQRLQEAGTLLALGFHARQVRRLFLLEGACLALVGGLLGMAGGFGYARAMLYGLSTLWREAVGPTTLQFHASGQSVLAGALAAALLGAITIALTLRKHLRQPARALLAGDTGLDDRTVGRRPRRARGLAVGAASLAILILCWGVARQESAPAAFFGAGSLLLISGLGLTSSLLTAWGHSQAARRLTLTALGVRGVTRRRRRSLACVTLLACGSFLIIAVGANKLDSQLHAERRSSGTGGFALIGESTLPVWRDLDTEAGREFYGLNPRDWGDASVVSLRVKPGDDASCLTLNRAQQPRLVGVDAEALAARQAFTFAKTIAATGGDNPWLLLRQPESPDVIPAIGDANSILWAMGRKVGDTLDYTDERGRRFQVRLVGALANSILQGQLLIDERAFVHRFPSEGGYRMFLVDAPSNAVARLSAALSRALQDVGLELTPTARRLAQFNAVQNTYLNTFQVLGGLGLLLGSAGLGVVVLRNVLERRGELALLRAVAFRPRSLRWLILSEHVALLCLGLAVGALAAAVAILPVLLQPGADVPVVSLAATLAVIWCSGLLWTWWATRLTLHGQLLAALRHE